LEQIAVCSRRLALSESHQTLYQTLSRNDEGSDAKLRKCKMYQRDKEREVRDRLWEKARVREEETKREKKTGKDEEI
jgi:hypothetical protein